MKVRLHTLIFLGMGIGLVVGLGLWAVQEHYTADGGALPGWVSAVLWWLDLLGPTLFMGALKMIIAPLILASIIAGVTSLPNLRELGAIGWKTLVFYAVTTSIAVTTPAPRSSGSRQRDAMATAATATTTSASHGSIRSRISAIAIR